MCMNQETSMSWVPRWISAQNLRCMNDLKVILQFLQWLCTQVHTCAGHDGIILIQRSSLNKSFCARLRFCFKNNTWKGSGNSNNWQFLSTTTILELVLYVLYCLLFFDERQIYLMHCQTSLETQFQQLLTPVQ